MWYEILPAFTCVCVAMMGGPYLSALTNRIIVGKWYRRSLESLDDRMLYLHDRVLTNNPYKMIFEVPDEDDDGSGGKKKKKRKGRRPPECDDEYEDD